MQKYGLIISLLVSTFALTAAAESKIELTCHTKGVLRQLDPCEIVISSDSKGKNYSYSIKSIKGKVINAGVSGTINESIIKPPSQRHSGVYTYSSQYDDLFISIHEAPNMPPEICNSSECMFKMSESLIGEYHDSIEAKDGETMISRSFDIECTRITKH